MDILLTVRTRLRPSYSARLVVILVIILVTARWFPWTAPPLALGAGAGCWLAPKSWRREVTA
jgi:hypothetical protein